jgi:hypothetical protein
MRCVKMKIKQHIPAACEGDEPLEVEFNSLEELLEIPFVKKFSQCFYCIENPNHYFKQFSLSHYVDYIYLLIAEFEEHPHLPKHWVVGYIHREDTLVLDLPIWEPTSNENT